MIPKIIHYCWFGGNEKPKDIQKYISGWKEMLPEYQFIEWNESNFDIENSIPYVKEAYEAKKFAFVSDYVRIYALYHHGGVYLDTDVEILKPFDEYLDGKAFVGGFERANELLTAFWAVEKKHYLMEEFLDSYNSRVFVCKDGSYDMTPITEGFSLLLESQGVDLNKNEYQEIDKVIAVYPVSVFCGFDVSNWHEKITDETCMVHHMNASWVTGKSKVYFKIIRFSQKILGYRLYDWLKGKIRKK